MPVGAYAVASDTGRRRRRNEDNYVVAPPLFAVADGMGGAQAGEVASQLAASALEAGDSDGLDGTERIDALIQEANRRIYDRASTDPAASGMGTTMTVALVEGMTRRDRPRRRLARLPRPRRADGAADRGPLARERAAEDRQALRGGGAGPSAAQRDHAGGRHGSRRRRRRLHDRGRGWRRLPHLLRRAQRHGLRRGDPRARPPEPRRPRQGREGARRGREPGRRRGQHHRGRLPDLVRGRAEPRGHGRDARDHRGRRTSPTSRRASTRSPTRTATR